MTLSQSTTLNFCPSMISCLLSPTSHENSKRWSPNYIVGDALTRGIIYWRPPSESPVSKYLHPPVKVMWPSAPIHLVIERCAQHGDVFKPRWIKPRLPMHSIPSWPTHVQIDVRHQR